MLSVIHSFLSDLQILSSAFSIIITILRIKSEHDLGSIKICKEILQDALDLFQKHPDDIIRVE